MLIRTSQPRRISAISLARRVSQELGERKQDLGGRNSLVGYAIRLESCMSSSTRLVYATTVSPTMRLNKPVIIQFAYTRLGYRDEAA